MNTDLPEICSIIGHGNVIVHSIYLEKNFLTLTIEVNSGLTQLKLYEVANLEIRTGPYNIFSLVGLQIEDISAYQMEGKKIRITSEDDVTYLFCYCKSIEVYSG